MPGPDLSLLATPEGMAHLEREYRATIARRLRGVQLAPTLHRSAELAATFEGRDMDSLSREELHPLAALVSLAETAKRLIDPPPTRKPARA